MKIKFVSKKEIITKVIMSAVLLTLLFLSFLFSDKLEYLLKMNVSLRDNECLQKDASTTSYNVHYIDVGQGNCAFVELPDGKNILIDGGNTMYGLKIEKFLKSKNVETIDYMIATHADSDHIGGLNHVLECFEVRQIIRPFQICGTGSSFATFEVYEHEDLKPVYDYYLEAYGSTNKISRATSLVYKNFISNIYSETYTEDENKIQSEVVVFYDGLKIYGENYKIEFYAPLVRDENLDISLICEKTLGYATKGYGVSNSNDASAIFVVTCFNDKYLFSGDASWENGNLSESVFENSAESDFINSLTNVERAELLNISVYLAGHHGSTYSSSSALLNLINPKFVVFSVGEDNSYGHPSSSVVSRISELESIEKDWFLRTDEMGTITFANIEGEIVYCLEISEHNAGFMISWQLFASVVTGLLILVVIFLKPKRHSRT